MKTEDLIRYIAIAGGAYLLYKWWQQQQSAAVPPAQIHPTVRPPSQQPAQPATGGGTAQPAPSAGAANAAARIKALAEADFGPNPSLTADQWNVYAQGVLGREMPDPERFRFTGDERFRAVQFDTYWTRLVSSALIPGLGWLGMNYEYSGWGAGLSAWMS
jgi:hypothetical protein